MRTIPIIPLTTSPGVVRFDVSERTVRGVTILRLSGELDVAAPSTLLDEAVAALGVGSSDLVLDATELRFLDTRGASEIYRLAVRTRREGHVLRLAAPPPVVQRVLRVCGLLDCIVVEPTLDTAVDAVLRGTSGPPSGRPVVDVREDSAPTADPVVS